ncbi:hypothetical protein HW115_17885 [Verrucomicrobiaceae bacterium N1E253]|uniref:Uncharacterized protein n=1 Tax=Oceaniferula marina TaxID=2748318 RepID=A0A851GJ06_9BACT|nr:hypothetical protein [Oceaniferula marina]NWK57493.1 hypothetical protein [Oceaniferula marina]
MPTEDACQCSVDTEGFTIDLMWDDFELRTWQYDQVKDTLGKTDKRLLNWIGSIDQSGYTREKCLYELITAYEQGDENRILLRLSDWVSQVRDIARDWVIENFHQLPLESIYSNQRLILYLFRKERLQSDQGVAAIRRDLKKRIRLLKHSQYFEFSPMFRRFLFSLSGNTGGKLRRWVLDDPEPFNRLQLLNNVEIPCLTDDEQGRLASDQSIFVRRRYFYSLVSAGIRPTQGQLGSLAMDRNQSLRLFGQYYLNKFYQADAYSIYKTQDGEVFYFIADYARSEDADHFIEGVRTGSKLTKLNCLRALASCAEERVGELDIRSLLTENRRLRAVIVPLLPRMMSVDQFVELREVFESSSPYGKISFLRILEKQSFWAFVDVGLTELLNDKSEVVRNFIVQSVLGKSAIYESLSASRRQSIQQKIQALRHEDSNNNTRLMDLIEFSMEGE